MHEAMTREAEEVARTTGLKKEMRAEYVLRYVEQRPWCSRSMGNRTGEHQEAISAALDKAKGTDRGHSGTARQRPQTAKSAEPAVTKPRTPKRRPRALRALPASFGLALPVGAFGPRRQSRPASLPSSAASASRTNPNLLIKRSSLAGKKTKNGNREQFSACVFG
jgi:hypothetical protein